MANETKSEQILNLSLTLHNRPTDSEEYLLPAVRARHLDKIENFIERQLPVHFILPAYPAKSPNPKKTVSHRPDYGEVLSLCKLNDLCNQIGSLHEPGAHITICSDGRVFSDVVQVCDGAVDAYAQGINEILESHGLQNLSLYRLDDVFSTPQYGRMRERLMTEFAEELEKLRTRILSQPDMRHMFNGIHRFMFEDQVALFPEQSRSQSREVAKTLAYEVIRRSNAWSRLIEARYSDALRLSIHPQMPNSHKIAIRLMPSNDPWRTPWHSVTVFDGKEFFLSPRSEAEASGAELKYAHGKYPYYRQTQSSRLAQVAAAL